MSRLLKVLMIVGAIIAALTAALMMHGCAHVTAVERACKPAPADVDTALADLQADGWKTALEAFAIAKGACIAKAAVQEIVDALTPKGGAVQSALIAVPDGTPSSEELVARGREFLASH